jgi:transposase-like protein
MAETTGASRSAAIWATVQGSQAEVGALVSRRIDDLKLLAVYVDRLNFGEYAMDGAVGLDSEGHKHVPGIREGTTENATVVTDLLGYVVLRSADTKRKMLFVIDGSKALRAAINAVFGTDQKV